MDLGARGQRSPSSQARARASGSPSCARSPRKARRRGRRAHARRARGARRREPSRSTSPARAGPRRSSRERSSATAASTCSSTTSGGVQLRLGRVPRDERRRLRGVAAAQLPLRPAGHACGGRGDAAAGAGAIVNVASVNAFFQPDGLVIDYGAAKAALLNVAKALSQELGPEESGSTASRPGRSRPTSGSGRTASPRRSARSAGIDAGGGAEQATAGDRHGAFQHARGGRDARGAAGLAADRQRDRRRTT